MKKLLSLMLTATMLISTIAVTTPFSAIAVENDVSIANVCYKSGENEIYAIVEGSITSELTINSNTNGTALQLITASYAQNPDGSYELSGIAMNDVTANGTQGQKLSAQTVSGATSTGLVKVMLWDSSNNPVAVADVLNSQSRDTRIKDVYITNNGKEYQILFNELNGKNDANIYMDGTISDMTSVPAKVRTMSGAIKETNLDLSGSQLTIKSEAQNGLIKDYTYNLNINILTDRWSENWTGSEIREDGTPTSGSWVHAETGTNVVDEDPKYTRSKVDPGNTYTISTDMTDPYTNSGNTNSAFKATRNEYEVLTISVAGNTNDQFAKSICSADIYATGETKFWINGSGVLISNNQISIPTGSTAGSYNVNGANTFGDTISSMPFALNEWHRISYVVWKDKSNSGSGNVTMYIDGKAWFDTTSTYACANSSGENGYRPGNRSKVFSFEITSANTEKVFYMDNNSVLANMAW